MSVGSPLYTLLKSNFRAWIGAKGFWLVAAGALLPMLLTGAWVAAHQADIAVTDLRIEGDLVEGQEVRFVATVTNVGKGPVGPFNATIEIAPPGSIFASAQNQTNIERLRAGESREVTLTWTATPGAQFAIASADVGLQRSPDEVGERDEYNNFVIESMLVRYREPAASPAPQRPATLSGDANATDSVSLAVTSLTRPESVTPGDNVTFEVTVTNEGTEAVEDAPVGIRVSRVFGGRVITEREAPLQNVSLGPGESTTVQMTWTSRPGAYWHDAWIAPPAGASETDPADNHLAETFTLDDQALPDVQAPRPEERVTIKEFYVDVLSLLHLRLLIPLIALFYAAGVIADEKERGSLPYTLTRPVPRWMIPITKFVASFLVAAVALAIGVTITYLFLFGTTTQGQDIGFLTTPLLATLVTLFAYGAVFILLGTLVERPYLVGLALVLGWEYAAYNFVDWVRNLTLTQHVSNALVGWRLDQGVQFIPEGDSARALGILIAIGVGALALAAVQMKRREFQV